MSSRLPWLIATLILAIPFALLQGWAVENSIYWQLPWFDVLMHYLGGLVSVVFLIAILHQFRPWLLVAAAIAVFVGWEVFEYVAGVPKEANFAFDTTLDILMDTLGAITAYGIARFSLWRSR